MIYQFICSAWLKDEEHEIVHRINRRIDLMTNLEQETSEELQVCVFKMYISSHARFSAAELIYDLINPRSIYKICICKLLRDY